MKLWLNHWRLQAQRSSACYNYRHEHSIDKRACGGWYMKEGIVYRCQCECHGIEARGIFNAQV